jgi:hypothetical protein
VIRAEEPFSGTNLIRNANLKKGHAGPPIAIGAPWEKSHLLIWPNPPLLAILTTDFFKFQINPKFY